MFENVDIEYGYDDITEFEYDYFLERIKKI
jgi:hypothetical protein